uniref:Isoform 2 of Flap endonuclease 1 n=1 Tax=Danio rerio TaxID=7955 RepID=Q6TNU4-2|nr:Flap structure-specific endonuclease 1 [Danio rerio]
MGIHGLAKLIADHAPSAIKEHEIKSYFGRKIAIDASMCIYQFLIAVRQDGNVLQNEDGETTSHLMGMFYRTIRMLESGIKPVYVFDGKPPQLKSGELEKRVERRAEAEKLLAQAQEAGEQENIDKFSKRLVKVTKQHNEECKKLLSLMGVPYIEAPCEAEASCAALVKAGKVYATATEDMDGLTFGTTVLLRHLTASEAKKLPIQEFHFSRILQDMELTHQQAVDTSVGQASSQQLVLTSQSISQSNNQQPVHGSSVFTAKPSGLTPLKPHKGRHQLGFMLPSSTSTLHTPSSSFVVQTPSQIPVQDSYISGVQSASQKSGQTSYLSVAL